ncbi:hypothetical protein DICPUDRAFT_84840 [Dictyostelium purpureum]|uniref:Uncharacterized protein n=1 Tax=Dictyostelium purpureum TaxID=5786 RepID=F1A3X1_DICPU|nr:uncharacterized protein DICPUDRAFT_84840 [Dictyostelium purpureum]EGC29110.1 hypothetical protein DICPUDRAFT_84840 [Dictyostelium purpureum]|eukprot:XP_003294365.1 hypothetical protein DICPUDRAFT_84840 [Dictyostelium purpureum]
MFLTSPTICNVKISNIFEYFNPTPTSVFIENQLKLTILENLNLIESFWVLPIIYFIWKIFFKEINIKSSKSPIIHHIVLVIILITIFWFVIQPLVSNGVIGVFHSKYIIGNTHKMKPLFKACVYRVLI